MAPNSRNMTGRACLAGIFLYLALAGCTEPDNLLTPVHLTAVPGIDNFQANVGLTSTGKRRVLLTWRYDSLNTNIRSWDVQRSVNDSTRTSISFLELIRKPASGYPLFIDSTSVLQSMEVDSLDIWYRVVPNGIERNFIGQPSGIMHVIVRRNINP